MNSSKSPTPTEGEEELITSDTNVDRPMEDASRLLSCFYAIFVIILSLVICTTYYITTDVSESVVDTYFVLLYFVASAWLISFRPLSTSCYRKPEEFGNAKSNQSINRWLKCILVLFGIAIITKNILEFLAIFQFPTVECMKPMYFLAPVAQTIFVVTEVNFLFQHARLHIQDNRRMNRFAVMHIIASNLSVWILIVINESMQTTNVDYTVEEYSTGTIPSHLNNSESGILETFDVINHTLGEFTVTSGKEEDGLGRAATNKCVCNTTFCEAVYTSHTFLYPFLIEFSLIASCMMYILWKNIGVQPSQGHMAVKPTYKFYKSYKGFVAGNVAFIATVVILIILSTSGSDFSDEEKSYGTETVTLIIHNSFLVILELVMTASCIAGIVLFLCEPRPVKPVVSLDAVVLLVTIIGTITMDIFYAFAVYTSMLSAKYEYTWIWGAVYPVVNILQCVLQVVLILAGLSRKPVTVSPVSDMLCTESGSRIGERSYVNRTYVEEEATTPRESVRGIIQNETNDTPRRRNYTAQGRQDVLHNTTIRSSSKIAHSQGDSSGVFWSSTESDEPSRRQSLEDAGAIGASLTDEHPSSSDIIVVDNTDSAKPVCEDLEMREFTKSTVIAPEKHMGDYVPNNENATKLRIAPPNQTRMYIRDAAMFLLAANACMWIFWSLEGTAFHLYTYPYEYYDQSGQASRHTWKTISMVCLPLNIFFRMHSSACLFEIWSLT